MLKNYLELVLNPFFFIFIILLFCAVYLKRHNNRMAQGLFLVSACIVIFCTGWLPRFITQQLEHSYPIIQEINPQVKWVVVLGGGHHEIKAMPANNLLTSASIKRMVEGMRLIRLLPHAKLVLSGGGESKQMSEAFLLQTLSEWFSIAHEKIALEPDSLNTEDQAKLLGSIVHQEPFYLVTSAIHMPRAMALCLKQSLKPIAAPTDFTFFWHDDNEAKLFIPNSYNLYYFTIAMHELLGRAWMAIKFD